MLDRSGYLIASSRTHLATAGMALAMLMIATGVGWPQAVSPSSPPSSPSPSSPSVSLGVQTPAQPATPGRPAAATVEPAPSSPPPAREENPGLINEMGKMFEKSLSILPTLKSPGETIDDLNARAKDAGETLAPGHARDGDGACEMPGFGKRCAGLQGRCRQALPDQGVQAGQEPHQRCRGDLLGESSDSRPGTKAGRLPDRSLRYPCALPVEPGYRRKRG